jgi:hypothetical protein
MHAAGSAAVATLGFDEVDDKLKFQLADRFYCCLKIPNSHAGNAVDNRRNSSRLAHIRRRDRRNIGVPVVLIWYWFTFFRDPVVA